MGEEQELLLQPVEDVGDTLEGDRMFPLLIPVFSFEH